MPGNPPNNVKSSGSLQIENSGVNGPAGAFSSKIAINTTGIVTQESNNGTAIKKLYGDGRNWTPVQTATPATPVPGQFWIETVGATSYFAFVDHLGAVAYLQDGSPAPLLPLPLPLTNISPATNQLDYVLVDSAGLVSWEIAVSNAITGLRATYHVSAVHNGTTTADATTAWIEVSGGAQTPMTTPINFTVTLFGAGGTQEMRLLATTTLPDFQQVTLRVLELA